jgi:hypothetical protein
VVAIQLILYKNMIEKFMVGGVDLSTACFHLKLLCSNYTPDLEETMDASELIETDRGYTLTVSRISIDDLSATFKYVVLYLGDGSLFGYAEMPEAVTLLSGKVSFSFIDNQILSIGDA